MLGLGLSFPQAPALLSGVRAPPSFVPQVMRDNIPPDWWIDKTLGLAWFKQGNLIVPLSSAQTVSRPSATWQQDSSSNWSSFGANLAARTDRGQSIWETRTNSNRNSSMQGAVVGSPGTLPTFWSQQGLVAGLVRTIVGIGTFNGIPYIDINYAGTTTASGTVFQIVPDTTVPASTGQTWTPGVFFQVLQDDSAVTTYALECWQYDATNSTFVVVGSNADSTIYANRMTWRRIGGPLTLGGGATVGNIRQMIRATNTVASGTTINLTIRIGMPTLELGSGMSPPIFTTNVAASRSGEVDTILTQNMPAFGSEYTIYGEGRPSGGNTNGNDQAILQVDAGSSNDRFSLRRTATGLAFSAFTAAGTGGNTSPNSGDAWAAGSVGKLIASMKSGRQAFCFGGNAIRAGASALPATPSAVRDGSLNGGGAAFNGDSIRIGGWNTQAVPDALMQAYAA